MHPFEQANLGQAPFRIVGYDQAVGPIRCADGGEIGAPGQPMGTCAHCGQGIKYRAHVRSHDGRSFTVGLDCAMRVGSEANRLMSDAERIKKQIAREQRAAKAAARRAEREAVYQAKLQGQRDCNGGMTDWEMAEAKRRAEAQRSEAEMVERNAWLLEVLADVSGDFAASMSRELRRFKLVDLSDRAISILRDIYRKSKMAGRRATALRDQYEDEFDQLAGL